MVFSHEVTGPGILTYSLPLIGLEHVQITPFAFPTTAIIFPHSKHSKIRTTLSTIKSLQKVYINRQ